MHNLKIVKRKFREFVIRANEIVDMINAFETSTATAMVRDDNG